MLADDAADGIHDLAPAAVRDREVDVQTRVPGRPFLRGAQRARQIRGQHLGAAHVLDTPVGFVGDRVGELGDDLDEIGELFRVALGEIVGRQEVERHDADAEIVTPSKELPHLRGARAVSVGDRRVPGLPGPPAIAVDHHRDMMRHRLGCESPSETRTVETVEQPFALTRAVRRHGSTLPLATSVPYVRRGIPRGVGSKA